MKPRIATKLVLPPISSAAPGTLYQQVVDAIKREVIEGRLRPGAALPSFRALAEDLLVSVITVKRAYEELEREGVLYRKQGLGTFVADRGDTAARDAQRLRAEERLREALRECIDAGMPEEEIAEVARQEVRAAGGRPSVLAPGPRERAAGALR
ncbi:MAG: GntR family transcriptional regulator [Candidatus Hydrogenedentes bacterium]|nr:GntR family transcriptional regulator [Candidatus Hydrogenedentota bacterium]